VIIDSRTVVQVVTFLAFLFGTVLICFCHFKRPEPQYRGYAVGLCTWIIHGTIFYAFILSSKLLGWTPIESTFHGFLFGDWSAALRLHGALIVLPTIYALMRLKNNTWKLDL
jgi:hypothetical protein